MPGLYHANISEGYIQGDLRQDARGRQAIQGGERGRQLLRQWSGPLRRRDDGGVCYVDGGSGVACLNE